MGDVRVPSTEVRSFFWTSNRTNGGNFVSSAVLRSQSPPSHSIRELRAQRMGTDPSSGAATAVTGESAMPTTAPVARSARIGFPPVGSLLHGVAAALETGHDGVAE